MVQFFVFDKFAIFVWTDKRQFEDVFVIRLVAVLLLDSVQKTVKILFNPVFVLFRNLDLIESIVDEGFSKEFAYGRQDRQYSNALFPKFLLQSDVDGDLIGAFRQTGKYDKGDIVVAALFMPGCYETLELVAKCVFDLSSCITVIVVDVVFATAILMSRDRDDVRENRFAFVAA